MGPEFVRADREDAQPQSLNTCQSQGVVMGQNSISVEVQGRSRGTVTSRDHLLRNMVQYEIVTLGSLCGTPLKVFFAILNRNTLEPPTLSARS